MEWLRRLLPHTQPLTAEQRAKNLLEALDAGGLPLHAAVINDIARHLGLEVSAKAPMAETIARIRNAMQRR